MERQKAGIRLRRSQCILLALAALLLLSGGGIYILFRSDSIILFRWIESAGLLSAVQSLRAQCGDVRLSPFVLYTLPDALWLTAYLLVVNAVFIRGPKWTYLFWVLFLPVLAIVHELLQKLHVASGVFDMSDLICYLIPLIINLIYFYYRFCYEKAD